MGTGHSGSARGLAEAEQATARPPHRLLRGQGWALGVGWGLEGGAEALRSWKRCATSRLPRGIRGRAWCPAFEVSDLLQSPGYPTAPEPGSSSLG